MKQPIHTYSRAAGLSGDRYVRTASQGEHGDTRAAVLLCSHILFLSRRNVHIRKYQYTMVRPFPMRFDF